MIEILRNFPDNVVAISCEGQVTKENYERIFKNLIGWARFGNLFAYDEEQETVSLPEE